MSTAFTARLQEVQRHYQDNDYDLAFRRLADCALETRNMDVFRAVLAWCDRMDAQPSTGPHLQEQAADLLAMMEQAGITATTASGPILQATAVSKHYKKGTFTLAPLDMALSTGGITGLVGENGNGKTTLLRLLAAELRPDSGNITYAFPDAGQDGYDLCTRLIYIEQRIPRWYGGLMDNLRFTLASYGIHGEGNELWAQMMVARLGLRPYRELNWNRISSGYKTKFELARTLLRRPQLLLLDEPLANLDIKAQQTILQDLKFMAGSLTAPFGMVLSSQHIYEVEKVSDRIIFLRNGAAQYQDGGTAHQTGIPTEPLIYELETGLARESLQQLLMPAGLERLQFNGGVYTLYFRAGTGSSAVLEALALHKVPVQYLRDITHSSRRFFNN